ncbi:ATP--cobalamin adenosyltransferase [Sulfuricella sp. T08]|uniref:cob(I)yrinic acid a,c-diamide adenosyltransferase n=1 Tax=Sulfuricella sp. T08 TaxID=1632857 RepID=UPI0006179E0D|nr:cob(I)yrinic acid a,c-diamide adenosyltransferase [Sulfuricella sp. T08]GAO37691.1 ATP--cobalamin adenosyltransferase [Sulfuricella sp. T08]
MRLSKITTRTGDDGTTGLADGSRLSKDSPRIEAIGAVDELNSQIGLLLTEELPLEVRDCLAAIQHDLFDLGGELALPQRPAITDTQVARLEMLTGQFNADLSSLKEFILPGGSRSAALCHVARTICRRTECACVRLNHVETLAPFLLQYLNRLSDLLFVLARVINRDDGVGETLWQKR